MSKNNDGDTMTPAERKVFDDWKKTVKLRAANQYTWIQQSIGQTVEIYMARAPKVFGVIRKFDQRFGRVMIETEEGMVECAASGITQVRYVKK